MQELKNLLPATIGQLEPAAPESQLQKIGVSAARLGLALQAIQFKKTDPETIDQTFRRIFILVGLRAQNFPGPEESQILFEHAVRYYGNHSSDEMILAFEMAIAGQLEIDPRDISTYENFTCLYFSRIMNAFRSWSGRQIREAEKQRQEPAQIGYKPDNHFWQSWLKELVDDWLAGEAHVEFMPLAVYDWLKSKNVPILDEKQIKEIPILAKGAAVIENVPKSERKEFVKSRSRKIALFQFLPKLSKAYEWDFDRSIFVLKGTSAPLVLPD